MAESSVLVSVVIATNRAGEFLREALASVREQTHPAVEVIVVDDGSPRPEAVAAAAEEVPGARIVRLDHSGASVARNVGAALASGRHLAFLDDDDRWDPDRIAAAVARLEARPDAVLVYCGMRTIDARGRVLGEADQVAVAGRLDVARRRTGILLPNVLIRADAFAAVGGFHSRIRLAEDLDLVLRLAEHGAFVFEPRALVDYRTHDANTTRRHRALVRGIDRVLRLHRAAAQEDHDAALVAALQESLRKNDRFAWWAAGRAARSALAAGHPGTATAELLWAARTAPRGFVDGLARRLRRRERPAGAGSAGQDPAGRDPAVRDPAGQDPAGRDPSEGGGR
ncbi:glycosyltransferase family 2 protein [Microbacterium xylanilyticum]